MMIRHLRGKPWLAGLVLAIASVAPLWHASERWFSLVDDSYITLTYARNLGQGHGFVYNHGEPTLGTTTPFFTMICAVLYRVLPWFDLGQMATYFSALCVVGTAWLLFLCRNTLQLGPWQAATIGLFLIATMDPFFLGMESYLYTLLMLVIFVLALQQRWFFSGFCCGLLYLTRGDGVLFAPCVALAAGAQIWLTERPRFLVLVQRWSVMFAGFALVVGTWSVYSYRTFGRLFPNSLAAKQAQATFLPFPRFDQDWRWRWDTWGTFETSDSLQAVIFWLAALGVVVVLARRRAWTAFLVFALVYFYAYCWLRILAFPHYYVPLAFVGRLCAGLGLAVVAHIVATAGISPHTRKWTVLLRRGLAAAMVLLVCAVPAKAFMEASINYKGDWRLNRFREVIAWLNTNTKPGDTVACTEVGYFGYFTQNAFVDMLGIVTPDVIPHMKNRDLIAGFFRHNPDYYVAYGNGGFLSRLHLTERFQRNYQLGLSMKMRAPYYKISIFRRTGSGE